MKNTATPILPLLAIGGIASGATLITPTSVTLNSGSQFFPIGNVVNNSGLSGTPTDTNYSTVTHANASGGNAWTTNASVPDYYPSLPTPVMTFDLGSVQNVSSAVVWGYHFGSPNSNELKTIDFQFSNDNITYGPAVTVDHDYSTAASDVLPFGGSYEAQYVRATITDNHFGSGPPGGDRVGLGEIKFIGDTDAYQVVTTTGTTYSYTTTPTFSGGTFYLDDGHPGNATAGAFGAGDLTDGITHPDGSAPTTGPVNSLVGWGDPVNIATDIVMDLGDDFYTPEEVIFGAHLWAAFANGAPDGVEIFVGNSPSIASMTSAGVFSFGAPSRDGHWDFTAPLAADIKGQYLGFRFDGGAVLAGNTPNKWLLDEITVLAQVPEPSRAVLLAIGLCGFLLKRGRKQSSR